MIEQASDDLQIVVSLSTSVKVGRRHIGTGPEDHSHKRVKSATTSNINGAWILFEQATEAMKNIHQNMHRDNERLKAEVTTTKQILELGHGLPRGFLYALTLSTSHGMLIVVYNGRPITLWGMDEDTYTGSCGKKLSSGDISTHMIIALAFSLKPSIRLLVVTYLDSDLALLDPFVDQQPTSGAWKTHLRTLTKTSWPSNHQAILNTRRRLPVYSKYEQILDIYHQSQVMILSSDTGSGKSTQVPQLLVYDKWASDLQIACTQPRRLAAKELAERVADEMGVVHGAEVGSHVRFEAMTGKKTRLVYMTEGILLRKATGTDKDLKGYACVVVDEAHERTADTDLLLALLKGIVARRRDFRIIIMSATLDADDFKRYFDDCPLLHIPGQHYDKGVCVRLYTEATYDNLTPSMTPGILCQPLESLILTLAAAGYSKVMDFDWISLPHPEPVSRAAYNLRAWEFLNDNGTLTPSSTHAAKCPLDPIWYRAMVVANSQGCTMDILDLTSISSAQGSIFVRPKQFQQVADMMKSKWARAGSDHIPLLNAFHAFEDAWEKKNNPGVDLDEWCFDNFLNRHVLEDILRIRKDLIAFLRPTKLKVSMVDSVSIRKTLAIAFCTQIATF
ncbi:P-loop containing nucleoside triphosphate hydrolase protein [Lasiosphaeria miniovina]|uniref:RNA helicase n=1 Tax=Lasiosphaeria miniovina TaxID=1954250 RepID=A0AA40AWK0_9PEZI|nr:P-loop containing nucleoside triphosphate hydrolase protein [Lasiosphaeria miniovina]KAK0723314.1 P-loop containing nucleoside triphosphate hydrolase protein [Lasiosphaeria miniovina]